MNILKKLKDLVKQARTEKSHYYTATTLEQAIKEIQRLQHVVKMQAEVMADWDI